MGIAIKSDWFEATNGDAVQYKQSVPEISSTKEKDGMLSPSISSQSAIREFCVTLGVVPWRHVLYALP